MANYGIKKTRADRVFDAVNIVLMVLLMLIVLYPLYFVIIASVSEPMHVSKGSVTVWPVGFTWDSYKYVFQDSSIWTGYRNTIVYVILGTLRQLVMLLPAAYAMSKRYLPGRRALALLLTIPMYFSGGLVPTYLQVRDLGLLNSFWTMIILGGVGISYLIICRNYFETSIPGEVYESARIDGASEFSSFFRIALPLSKPIIAVIVLYVAVSRWNAFFDAMIYLTNSDYFPLQLILRNILLANQNALSSAVSDMYSGNPDAVEAAARQAYIAEGMKYSLIFISCAPLLIAYPFVQKYFVTGTMAGSVKG